MRRLMIVMAAVAGLALWAGVASAGEWHTGRSNICWDCHTMHFSQTHEWGSATAVTPGTPTRDGNWLGSSGPNQYLLKMPVNQLCLTCHDGQNFAPDVLGANVNAAPTQGRSAGALNTAGLGGGYDPWKGHTLELPGVPPGWNPAAVGISSATYYDSTKGLECINCHTQHGRLDAYRNLGPRALTAPTYTIGTSNDTTRDVWINIPTPYAAGSGQAGTFNPFYDSASVSYNKSGPTTLGTTTTSNRLDTFCGACHGNFHGGPGDANIGGLGGEGFLRHPTSAVTIGALGGGHSKLSQFVGATTKVKVYANERTTWADASPGCASCHKAHGNQNPFGLVFLNRNALSVGEEGGYGTPTLPNDPQTPGTQQGYRNLCGQCHGQGN